MTDERARPKKTLLEELGDRVRGVLEDLVEAVEDLARPPMKPIPVRSRRR
ncbi:MAG: hypothetical protein ACOCV4_08465 [Myxococcota bacterium]